MERFLNATSRNLPPSSESEDIPTRKYFESFTDVLMVLVTFSAVIILLPLIFFKLFLQIGCCTSTLCSRNNPDVESASAGSNNASDLPPTYSQCMMMNSFYLCQPPPYSQCNHSPEIRDSCLMKWLFTIISMKTICFDSRNYLPQPISK